MCEVPVLLLIFNRPDTTRLVLEQIAAAQPTHLFVAADGPRRDVHKDCELCEQARKVVLDYVTWNCELKTLFREENFGCGRGVADAINWFFSHVDRGIILEDDCLPSISFFDYCSQLLNRYEDDFQIMHIAGSNFGYDKRQDASYFFSKYNFIWGWATWRDRWSRYQFNGVTISDADWDSITSHYSFTSREKMFWRKKFNELSTMENPHTWDYQWTLTVWLSGGLSIIPARNLVKNIGFGLNATHTKVEPNAYQNIGLSRVININDHPTDVMQDLSFDFFYVSKFLSQKTSLVNRLRNVFYFLFPKKFYNLIKRLFRR